MPEQDAELQYLRRIWVPFPHVTVQPDHWLQSDQDPWSETQVLSHMRLMLLCIHDNSHFSHIHLFAYLSYIGWRWVALLWCVDFKRESHVTIMFGSWVVVLIWYFNINVVVRNQKTKEWYIEYWNLGNTYFNIRGYMWYFLLFRENDPSWDDLVILSNSPLITVTTLGSFDISLPDLSCPIVLCKQNLKHAQLTAKELCKMT